MTAPALVVLRAGPATTVQDAGRVGFLRYGVTPAGPMDWRQHAAANLMAGNAPGMAAVEVGPGGLSLEVTGAPARLGIAAAGFRVVRGGSALPARACLVLVPGARLDILPGPRGVWGYVAPAGGFQAAPVMGSLSTHARSGLGPFGGAGLVAGMVLPLAAGAEDGGESALRDPATGEDRPGNGGPIRFVPGPQDDHFTPEALALFTAATWRLAPRSDRMAYRLDGPRLAHARGHDIVSDGIPLGAIQVPGDGAPLVLMADRQPTGGYPKLGCVIRADLPWLAQARAGATLRFAAVTVGEAVAALETVWRELRADHARRRALRRLSPPGPPAPGPK